MCFFLGNAEIEYTVVSSQPRPLQQPNFAKNTTKTPSKKFAPKNRMF